jgi:hypothetical protein
MATAGGCPALCELHFFSGTPTVYSAPYARFNTSGTKYASCAWCTAAIGNLNSLESYGTAVIKLHPGNSAIKYPYSYQIIQVDGFVAVCLNLLKIDDPRDLGPKSTEKRAYLDSSS